MGRTGVKLIALATGVALYCVSPAGAQQKEVLIGMQCDRTGATQITGVVLCPAMHDYYDLVNSQGGVEGYKIKADEIDKEYKVPAAVEAALGAEMDAGRRALAAYSRHPRVVHEVMRSLPGMWGLFVRLVSGQTSLDAQLDRRAIRGLVRVLGG